MKLRGKTQLLIGALVAVMLIIVGVASAMLNYTSIFDNVEASVKTSSILAAEEIGADIDNYMRMVEVSGEDKVLASTTTYVNDVTVCHL